MADHGLLQALLNLLGNAADASAANDNHEIQLSIVYDDHKLHWHIDDAGTGFDASGNKPDGLGLGLTLSNASIERLGGKVTLADRAGGGTRATITLPLHHP